LLCAQNNWKNHLKDAENLKAETSKVVARAAAREPFSVEGLLKRIAKFIVADDQVCFFFKSFITFILIIIQSIRVVECPEFRDLLLFACHDIEDSDLVKRDAMRDLIMDMNDDYFKLLKKELAVSCFVLLSRHSLIID
jgi:hypothetical protein